LPVSLKLKNKKKGKKKRYARKFRKHAVGWAYVLQQHAVISP